MKLAFHRRLPTDHLLVGNVGLISARTIQDLND